MFLSFFSFSFRLYFSDFNMLYEIQVFIVQLPNICTHWTIYGPVVHHSIKKEEIKTLITNNYKYCI